ncbi:hypothetical protein ACFPOE_04795 [Caenimonas terrae]|uniref:DUF2946 domain-containing protein n=1 Tax=Caenimonas terrae TaxID=696074 RepID=A0ABW0N874_9BURK
MAFAPSALASHRSTRLARAALLWLALAIALAQLVAVRHVYTHSIGDNTTQSGGKHRGGVAHCEGCVAAVALGGAAPPPAALLFAALEQHTPQPLAFADHPVAPQQRPYAIRAPPAIAS